MAASPGNAADAVQLDHGSASRLIVRPMAEGLGRFLWSTVRSVRGNLEFRLAWV